MSTGVENCIPTCLQSFTFCVQVKKLEKKIETDKIETFKPETYLSGIFLIVVGLFCCLLLPCLSPIFYSFSTMPRKEAKSSSKIARIVNHNFPKNAPYSYLRCHPEEKTMKENNENGAISNETANLPREESCPTIVGRFLGKQWAWKTETYPDNRSPLPLAVG